MRYRSSWFNDGDLRLRLRKPAQQGRRFGYRQLPILLHCDGITIMVCRRQKYYLDNLLLDTCWPAMACPDEAYSR